MSRSLELWQNYKRKNIFGAFFFLLIVHNGGTKPFAKASSKQCWSFMISSVVFIRLLMDFIHIYGIELVLACNWG